VVGDDVEQADAADEALELKMSREAPFVIYVRFAADPYCSPNIA
jgi:hypothetical protein